MVPVNHPNRYGLHGVGRAGSLRQQVARPAPLPPQANPWWWNPGRMCVEHAVPSFRARLDAFDPDLEVVKDGYTKRWNVWMRAPRFQNPICQGWKLLFIVDYPDDAVFDRLISASQRKWGNGIEYFKSIEREMAAAKAAKDKQALADTLDKAMESFDHSQIKVSMCGPSSGSKFTKYHS